jgi:hypothetical protein
MFGKESSSSCSLFHSPVTSSALAQISSSAADSQLQPMFRCQCERPSSINIQLVGIHDMKYVLFKTHKHFTCRVNFCLYFPWQNRNIPCLCCKTEKYNCRKKLEGCHLVIYMAVTHVCFRNQVAWGRRHHPQSTETAAARRRGRNSAIRRGRNRWLSFLNKAGYETIRSRRKRSTCSTNCKSLQNWQHPRLNQKRNTRLKAFISHIQEP